MPGEGGSLPVTVVGGYLGAGKTTLINHLLRHAGGLRLAVLVNDFGELPIDADLIESRDDNVISITGGCMCCTYGSDLMAALLDFEKMPSPPDHLLIETSGVGLPAAIAQSVELIPRYLVDGIVVVADAETLLKLGKDKYLADTVERQLTAADIVLLNKVDLTRKGTLARTRHWLSSKAPETRVIETVEAKLPISTLLGSGLDRIAAVTGTAEHVHEHATHEAAVFPVDHPVDPEALAKRLAARDLDLIRTKGFVRSAADCFWSIQTVGRRWFVSEVSAEGETSGRIVCITHRPPIAKAEIARIIGDACVHEVAI